MILENKNIFIREIELSDFNYTLDWLKDNELREKLMINLLPETLEKQKEWFLKYQQNKSKLIFIIG